MNMKTSFKPLPFAVLPLCLLLTLPCAAADPVPTDAIAQLELRAQQASPREQCFLYTELVHQMTELAGQQLLAGESELASVTLKRVEGYAALIHVSLARDTKRLKQTEMLMHTASRHLGEYLHLVSPEDKVVLQSTLRQLDKVNDELLTQVFAH